MLMRTFFGLLSLVLLSFDAASASARDFNYEVILIAPLGTQYEGTGFRTIATCNGVPIQHVNKNIISYIKRHEPKTGFVKAGTYTVGYETTLVIDNCNEMTNNQEVSISFDAQHLKTMEKKTRKVQPSSNEKELLGTRAPDYGNALLQKAIIEKKSFTKKVRVKLDGTPIVLAHLDGGDFKLAVIRR